MGEFLMTNADHAEIRTSAGVQAELRKVASKIAAQANSLAGAPGGYGTDLTVGSDRARAHVWPQTPKARRAEAKSAPLMQIVAAEGPQ